VRHHAIHLLTTGLLMAAAPWLQAQETWDTSFKISAGSLSGTSGDHLGSNPNWALAMEGSYPTFAKGSLVMEGGYRLLAKKTVQETDLLGVEASSRGVYGSVFYRHTDFHGLMNGLLDSFYVQGGLRYHTLKSTQTQILKATPTDTNPTRTDMPAGKEVSVISPVVGVGVRFTEKVSVEFNVFRMKSAGVTYDKGAWSGTEKTGNAFELALGVHL